MADGGERGERVVVRLGFVRVWVVRVPVLGGLVEGTDRTCWEAERVRFDKLMRGKEDVDNVYLLRKTEVVDSFGRVVVPATEPMRARQCRIVGCMVVIDIMVRRLRDASVVSCSLYSHRMEGRRGRGRRARELDAGLS